MPKTPIVHIAVLVPDPSNKVDYVARDLIIDGVNIGESHSTGLTYTYKKDKSDTCILTLRFPEPTIDLTPFKPGVLLRVSWGYLGQPLKSQKLAIKEITGDHKADGLHLKLDLVPIATYVANNPSKGTTIEELLNEQNLKLAVHYHDKEGRFVRIVYGPTKKFATEYYANEDVELVKKVSTDVYRGSKFKAPADFIGGTSIDPSTYVNLGILLKLLPAPLSQLEKQAMNETLAASLARIITQQAAGAHLSARDDELVISDSDYSSHPLYNFVLNKNIISLNFSKPSVKLSTLSHQIALVDPIKKQVESSATKVYIGKEVLRAVGINDRGTEIRYYRQAGEIYQLGPANTIEDAIKLNLSSATRVLENLREAVARDKANKANLATYTTERKDREHRNSPEQKNARWFVEEQQRYLFDTGGFTTDNVVNFVTFNTSPHSKDIAVNEAVNAEYLELFNTFGTKVVVEGDPFIRVFFNYVVAGSSPQVNGKYHAYNITHTIISGKYTVMIEGGKIPPDPATITEKLETKYGEIIEEKKIVGIGELEEVISILNELPSIAKTVPNDSIFFSQDSTHSWRIFKTGAAADTPKGLTIESVLGEPYILNREQ